MRFTALRRGCRQLAKNTHKASGAGFADVRELRARRRGEGLDARACGPGPGDDLRQCRSHDEVPRRYGVIMPCRQACGRSNRTETMLGSADASDEGTEES